MADKYISDHTRFIADLKAKNPGMEEGQRRGRALLWDKRIDLDESRRFHDSEVAQPAYVYQNYVGPAKTPDLPAGLAPGEVKTPDTPAANKS